MRVFYVDEDEYEEKSKRKYYVKIDNIDVPDELKGNKLFEASSTKELIDSIKVYYNLNRNPNVEIQLWPYRAYVGKRLDMLKEIPKEYEFLCAVVVLNKKE